MHEISLARVATAQYPVEFVGTWDRYVAKLEQMVEDAVANGAEILLFPEYACMELVSLFSQEIRQDLQRQLHAMQTLLADYRQLHRELARKHNVYLVSGSFPVRLPDGSFRNRAYFCTPDGSLDYQDKLIMTRWEREVWKISPGTDIKVFHTKFGMVGINICYDSEFPLLARQQAELGARLILVPSCTDTTAGYYRVRVGSQARALENQCYVVTAPLLCNTEISEAINHGVGAAAFYTPMDVGFPDNGILAMGEMSVPQWVIADVDLAKVYYIREHGGVTNYADWDGQHALHTVPVTEDWFTPALFTAMMNEKQNQGNVSVSRYTMTSGTETN